MSLETIVSKMIAANEPESNIAKVIKHYNKSEKTLDKEEVRCYNTRPTTHGRLASC